MEAATAEVVAAAAKVRVAAAKARLWRRQPGSRKYKYNIGVTRYKYKYSYSYQYEYTYILTCVLKGTIHFIVLVCNQGVQPSLFYALDSTPRS